MSQENNGLQNVWDNIKNAGPTNCPRCESAAECYAECDKDQMREFSGISNWANCKDKCLSLGGLFAYEFDKPFKPDRGCAMFSLKDQGKCVCVRGNRFACRNIKNGPENCPNCGGIFGGAPDCLAKCDWDHMQEFNDIADWGDCKDKCKSLGGDFTYKWGTWNSNRACAIYAKYDNNGNQGKCVCVEGDKYACDGSTFNDATPILQVPETGSPYDMMEGYGIGVISTLIILLIGIFVAYTCRKWNSVAKMAGPAKYAKVINVDETTDDERVVINK